MTTDNKNWLDILVEQATNITTAPIFVQMGSVAIFCYGNFTGPATAKLQFSPDDVMNTDLYATPNDATWFDVPDAIFTQQTYENGDLPEVWMRAKQTGSGVGTKISLKIRPRNSVSWEL